MEIGAQNQQKKWKKKPTKVWGPVQSERKSLRHVDDRRPMLEKAHNLKRKVNLDNNAGKKSYISAILSKATLLHIACSIDLHIEPADDSVVVDRLQHLDESRISTFVNTCKTYGCASGRMSPEKNDLSVDSLENRLEVTIPILNSNVEERLVQEEVRATPPEQIRNNLDNDLLEAEALSG